MTRTPTRLHAWEPIARRLGITTTQVAGLAAALGVADPVDATGDVFGDVSGSLLGPLNVVGIDGSPIDGPAEDKRPLRYDEASDTWIPSAIEALGTDELVTTKVLAPDGAGGLLFRAETGGGFGLPWFIPEDYGAVGDGTTDDTAACNLCIAALNAAGRGVLYLPSRYKVTSSLTTITVPCKVMGDGWLTGASGPISEVLFTSTSTSPFTVSANGCEFRDFAMAQTGGTATAGAAITSTGGILAVFDHLLISGFYQGIDLENAAIYSIRNCYVEAARKYGVRVRNTATPDAGDGSITGNQFSNGVPADAAMRIETGGARVSNNKVNGLAAPNGYAYGLDVAIGTGVSTSVVIVTANSFEGVTADGMRIATTGTGVVSLIVISGNEVACFTNTGRTLSLSGAGIATAIVAGNIWATSGTARAAVAVTNSTNVRIGPNVLSGFNAEYTNSGGTVTDASGAIGGGVAVVFDGNAGHYLDGTGALSTPTGTSLTVKDEGSALATAATSLDFVGSGVTATGTGAAKTITIPGGAGALDDLTDVVITSPALAQLLRYSGSAWVNAALIVSDYPYHDEVLCDSSGPILDSHGDVVMVTGVPN